MERLEAALDAGPAVWGWTEDQRWTLARVTALVGRLFHVSYTPRGISYLLHQLGWSPQVPQRRAAERDEEAIATWVHPDRHHLRQGLRARQPGRAGLPQAGAADPADLPHDDLPTSQERTQRVHRDRFTPACWTPPTSSSAGPSC
ncbi:helix-turn-helix domain-containing protein [Nonomuraea turkmeniaca]|uniref:helix-turn-helix domain-containing protein n=1 Tax=Nonomuraea turkmeniaca TaxID=103838 RepID=UPI003CCC7EFE